ncbi:cobalamin-dependent protein [Perlabentimonas gracilis]|uniref:cobalamin-dependent protein n=1 Tax=Perlabentimonas gracilis TaxID=2715279 RepID=UPI00140A96DB|nr:cobalamin-dependent protein [Perlabentimonas gracilis]NHB69582.1 cobalamin-binding protein [Perlabentimonas gracilis]
METNLPKQFEILVQQQSATIAEKIVELQYRLQPEFWKPYGSEGRMISVRDAGYHLPFLTEAVMANDPRVFKDYVAWVKTLFKGLNFPDSVMITTLKCTKEVLQEVLPNELHPIFEPIIDAGLSQMNEQVHEQQSAIDPTTSIGLLTQSYINSLLKGNRHSASKLIMEAVEKGVPVKTIYMEVFQKSQYEIGRLWLSNQISVAVEHFCSAATQSIMSQLYPFIFTTQRVGKTMVAACVGGELHEIGIRMVADFFEMDGWDTYYLGANSPANSIIKAIESNNAQVVALSAAMPFHRQLMRETISKIQQSNAGSNVKIMIGGHAVNTTRDDWRSFNADGYAPNAQEAIEVANKLTA